MNITNKVDLSRQTKLNELTLTDIDEIIDDGEIVLFTKSDNSLWIGKKTNGVSEEINATGNVIKNLIIPDLPDVSNLNPLEAYALSVVRDGFDLKLVWALVQTNIDYNA